VPINPNILVMAPYLITIAVVSGLVGRVRPPANDGKPYRPQ
jgi:simple sugar transport system permease protein